VKPRHFNFMSPAPRLGANIGAKQNRDARKRRGLIESNCRLEGKAHGHLQLPNVVGKVAVVGAGD
jgi:hypothetical protein